MSLKVTIRAILTSHGGWKPLAKTTEILEDAAVGGIAHFAGVHGQVLRREGGKVPTYMEVAVDEGVYRQLADSGWQPAY